MSSSVTIQFLVVTVISTGVGVVMARLGVRKGVLVPRASRRRCPSCGRLLSQRGCEHCGV
jgi:hypothetical protein